MKKALIAVVVLAAGGVAAMPYFTGKVAETETRRMVGEFNANPEQYGTTTIASYERGYGSSTVQYDYEPPFMLAEILDVDGPLKYDCDYQHGIMGVDFSCNLLRNEAYKKIVEDVFKGVDPIAITGAFSASGDLTQNIDVAEIDSDEDGVVFKLKPSRFTLSADKAMTVFDTKTEIGAMQFTNAEGSLNLAASELDMVIKPTELGLAEADYEMRIGDLNFVDQGQKTAIKGVEMSGTGVERGENMDYTLNMKIASLNAEGEQAFTVDNLVVDSKTLGLNSQALVDYQAFATQMQLDVLQQLESGEQKEPDPAQFMAILPIIENMMNEGLNISLAVSGDVMGKPNSAGIDFKLLKKTSFTELSAFMFNPEAVLGNLSLDVKTSLNKELVQSNPAVGAMIGSNPVFQDADGNYQTAIKVGAESSVNGKTVSFQELQGMLLSGMPR